MSLLSCALNQLRILTFRPDLRRAFGYGAILLGLTLTSVSWSAPHPGMGSSILANPKSDLAFLSRGYRFGLLTTPWKFSSSSLSEEKDKFSLEVSDLNSANVEVLPLDKKVSLKNFIQKSNRDYYHFGFEIRGKRELDLPHSKMVLIDLYHRKENKHLRQMILEAKNVEEKGTQEKTLDTTAENEKNLETLPAKAEPKERQVAIITCKFVADQKDSIKNCNDLGSLFSWISQKDAPKSSSLSEPRSESPSL